MRDWIKRSKVLWYSISTLILAALIYTADIGEFSDSLLRADTLYIFPALLAGLSVFLVFGLIWHRFFVKLNIEENLTNSYKLFMAGNFMNSVTPLGNLGGEPFMAYIVSKNTETEYEKALSSVMSADLVNLVPIFTFMVPGVIYLLFFAESMPNIRNLSLVIMTVALGGLITLYVLWSRKENLGDKMSGILDFLERNTGGKNRDSSLRNRLELMKKGFQEAGRDKNFLMKTALIAHLMPVAQFLCLYLIMLGLDIEPTLPGIYFTVMLSGLTYFSPTPGGSGTYEAAFSGLMIVFYPDIVLGSAVAAAVLFRLTTYWPGILIGYISLVSLKHSAGIDKGQKTLPPS